MKNLILSTILFLLAFVFNANAQYTMTGSGDTITDTGTKTATLQVKESYQSVSIQAVITKISGTVAGTVTLQGTIDGTNYVTVDTGAVLSKHVTFTATNVASQSTVFIVQGSPYLKYRVSYTGSGTMAAKMSAYLLPKK